jgi:hypothetical protein
MRYGVDERKEFHRGAGKCSKKTPVMEQIRLLSLAVLSALLPFSSHRNCAQTMEAVVDIVPGASSVSLVQSLVARFPVSDGVIAQCDMILIEAAGAPTAECV